MSKQKPRPTISMDSRGLGEATTVVLLIIVAVGAAGTISIAISGFTEGIAPSPGAELGVDKAGENVTFTVQSIDDGVAYLEFRGDFDTTSGGAEVTGSVTPVGGEDFRVDQNANDIETGDVIRLEGLEEGDRVTVVALDGDGNSNTITTVDIEDTGTA